MPRPISWLPRLHEIRRSVFNSVRSHYDRNDLERVFEVQPRSAQLLLELLPTVRLGRSLLVVVGDNSQFGVAGTDALIVVNRRLMRHPGSGGLHLCHSSAA